MKIHKKYGHNAESKHNEIGDEFDNYEEPKKWYEEIEDDRKSASNQVTEQVLIDLKDEAKKCHDSDVLHYNTKISKTNSNFQWMKTVMSKGTLSDKIAAHTITIQDNPVANLDNIRNLVSMVKVGKKKECTTVMETLTELFLSNLLISHRKLKPFHQRPLASLNELSSGNAVKRRNILSLWYFEDQLKEIYASFVIALNAVAHDTVESNKDKAVTAMYKLLADNSEQEKNLLAYIVNKLGDPSQKIASKVIYCLTQLLFKHVNMQLVVLTEIEKLLFRPNISSRAQYYSLCFLSQFHLSHETSNVARKLIEVYFSFFKACVKKGDVDSRMMSALLMGLNRAYPYAKMEFDKIQEHIDTMYRMVHMANFNISLHTLTLLYQVSDNGTGVSDRFYSALYRKLHDPNLLITTHRAMLLSLVYKALLKDKEINRVKMFVKRLLQISQFTQPCFSCGLLFLISRLMNKKKDLQSLILKQTTIAGFDDDDGDEKYQDVKEENDGEFSVPEIKEEVEDTEVKSDNLEVPASNSNDITSIEIKDEKEDVKPDVEILNASLNNSAGWYHCNNTTGKQNVVSRYNSFARNPLYGGGEFCAYVELNNLRNHFHPTVSLFATNIINGEAISYNGDPLNDFTLIKFLDRFVFKNPKKVGVSGRDPTFGKRKLYKPRGVKSLSVKSEVYARENPKNIPVDELFVHTYLQQKYQEKDTSDQEDSDLESVQSDEFEEMLDKLSGPKRDDELDEDVDYLNEIGNSLKNVDKNKKKNKTENDDEESDDLLEDEDEDDDLDEPFDNDDGDFDEEDELDMNDDDKALFNDLTDDDDEEAIEFSDEEESNQKKSKSTKRKGDIMSNFASAEEFATLLEEEGSSKVKPGGSNAYANKDNAHSKQLAWEESRNRWLNNYNKTIGGGKNRRFDKNNGKFSKKRPNKSKGGSSNKKFKK